MNIIVTGGLGYIGSGIAADLLKKGHKVLIIDEKIEDAPVIFGRIKKYQQTKGQLSLINCDILELSKSDFDESYDSIIHLAAYKSIEESLQIPEAYLENNISSLLRMIRLSKVLGVKEFIFSSSAAVYSKQGTCSETDEKISHEYDPYAYSKLIGEDILRNLKENNKEFSVKILRYFNPIGTYDDILRDESESLVGNILKALKEDREFTIFGNDYDTADGTCVRDYIPLRDVVEAHTELIGKPSESCIFNVGTGKATSVLEFCNIVKKINPKFKFKFGPRRAGDQASGVANPSKIYEEFGWKARVTIEDALRELC